MGLLTTALLVGAGATAFGAVNSTKEAKKSRISQEANMARQETQARELNRLDQTKEDTGANIEIGTDGAVGSKARRRSRSPRSSAIVAPSAGQASFSL